MNWTEESIKMTMADLADENALAGRALFSISTVEFTDRVPTLAVSLSRSPVLYINPDFINEYARTEEDLKAMLLHEFLHVLLNHTTQFTENDPILNIALDAVINAIIHRNFGEQYSEIFKRLYWDEGIELLLRPRGAHFQSWGRMDNKLRLLRDYIYRGQMTAGDLYELLKACYAKIFKVEGILFIGNHDGTGLEGDSFEGIPKEIKEGLQSLPEIAKYFYYRDSSGLTQFEGRIEKHRLARWKKDAFKILKQCLNPNGSGVDLKAEEISRPGYSSKNRRAFATLESSEILPFSPAIIQREKPHSEVNVYLDSSGSMSGEFNQLVSLLHSFRGRYKLKMWTFSTSVHRANFSNGKLRYRSTGGTDINCVFDHIRKTKPGKSLVVTDGYTGPIPDEMLRGIDRQKIRCLITPHGQPLFFQKQNIPYYQLRPLQR